MRLTTKAQKLWHFSTNETADEKSGRLAKQKQTVIHLRIFFILEALSLQTDTMFTLSSSCKLVIFCRTISARASAREWYEWVRCGGSVMANLQCVVVLQYS